ncbi:MAG: nucleotidyltransferase domain-containing protein [Nanoarchaeota archaeon]|nr:nucleotidyltransferase domain-containing protein [Nanoarchaeota archaeon]
MEDLLGSKTAIKVLNVLFDNPLQEFKEISLIESAKAGKGAASSLINRLIDEKFAVCKRAGKTKIVNLNILNESVLLLKAYFDNRRLKRLPKEAQASSELLKNKIKENISLMIIFGSYPAGTAAEESDIDILIVAENAGKIDEEKKKVEALFGKR